jgi:hypothetical protein
MITYLYQKLEKELSEMYKKSKIKMMEKYMPLKVLLNLLIVWYIK